DFQARPRRVHVGKMESVAVGEAGRVKPAAVVVDGAGPEDDLIAPVVIHITHSDAVGSLPGVGAVAADVAVENPASRQVSLPPIPGHEEGPRVVATGHHQARSDAIQIGGTREEAVDAVAVVVTPDLMDAGGGGRGVAV